MATSQEFLQSILSSVGKLMAHSEEELQVINADLHEVDNILDNIIDALEDDEVWNPATGRYEAPLDEEES